MAHAPRILLIDTESVVRGVTKVNLRGRLDASGVEAIEAAFDRLAGARQRLIIDLSRVSFIASAGLRTLVLALRKVTEDEGRMVFLQPDPSVEAVLITSGIDRLIPICRTVPDAIQEVSLGDGDDEEMPEQPLTFSLRIERGPEALRRAGAWVDELAVVINLSGRSEYALRLCLEEAITLIVTHGVPLPGANADLIAIRLVADPGQLSLTIQDGCAAFNPLAHEPPTEEDEADPVALGVRLMRQHARDLAWSRIGGTNRLAMTIVR